MSPVAKWVAREPKDIYWAPPPAPQRVRLSRAKGYRMPPNTRKVDRSTIWGNPFNTTASHVIFGQHGFPMPGVALFTEPSLGRCLDMYTAYLSACLNFYPNFLEPLRGKNLACWCPLDQPCHADVLLRLANGMPGNSPLAVVRAA